MLAVLTGCGATVRLPGPPANLDVQGHRGCRGLRPENSVAGFRHALSLGVSTLELDLRITRDRLLVVHHDPRLDRRRCVLRGEPLPGARLRDLDAAQLAGIDCGQRTDPAFPRQLAAAGSGVPRFEELLELAARADYPVHLNVEIKRDEGDPPVELIADLLAAAVERRGLTERTIVQSFSVEALQAMRRRAPGLRRAVLVRRRGDYDRMVESTGATILSPRYDRLRQADVQRFRQRGVAVVPWTVNDADAIRRLLDWGVDGIITDYPDRALEIYREARDDGRITPAGTRESAGASPGGA